MYFGWAQTPNGNIYYSDPTTGIIYTGRVEIDNNWYNFDDNGVLQTGWQTIDNKEYTFENGCLKDDNKLSNEHSEM